MWRRIAIAALVLTADAVGQGPRAADWTPASLPIPIASADLAAAAGIQRDDPSTLGLDIVRLAFASPHNSTGVETEARQAIARALESTGSRC